MKIQLKTGQTPNDDLSLIRDNVEKKVFDDITSLQTDFVNDVELTVGSNVGTPSGSATVSNNTLSLSFDNVKGNQGLDGDIGNQGKQGDSAVFDTNDTTSPDLVLSNTTGDSAFKSMTQKTITELSNDFETTLLDIINGNKYSIRIYGDGTTLESHYIVNDGDSFEQELLPSAGYVTGTVTVTMGQSDITSTSWDSTTHTVSITSVTDNVSINVQSSSVTNENMFFKRTTADGITLQNEEALLKSIKGNSMVFNQRWYWGGTLNYATDVGTPTNVVKGTGTAASEITYSAHLPQNSTIMISIGSVLTVGHKYLATVTVTFPSTQTTCKIGIGDASSKGWYRSTYSTLTLTNGSASLNKVFTAGYAIAMLIFNNDTSWIPDGGIDVVVSKINVIDLTQLFGSGNEPTTVADFRKYFSTNIQYDKVSKVLNNSMTNYISSDSEETTLQNLAVNVPQLTGKLVVDPSTLPYDSEVEYIQAVGIAYINTGIKGSSNVTFNLEYTFPEYPENYWPFGSRESSSSKKLGLFMYYNNYVSYQFGSEATQDSDFLEPGHYIFSNEESANVLKINNNRTITVTSSTWTSDLDFYIFTLNNNGTLGNSGDGMCFHGGKIYVSGTLVRDYVPVRSNGIGYLYDRVSKQLFGNAAESGSFSYGHDIQPRSYVLFPQGLKSSICLYACELTYLRKNDSTAGYFEIPYVPKGQDIVIKTKITPGSYISTSNSLTWFYCGWQTGENRYSIQRNGASSNTALLVRCGSTGYGTIGDVTISSAHEIELSYGQLKIGTRTATIDTTTGNENTGTLKLLAGINGYLYYFQVYKANELVVDCIPWRVGAERFLIDRVSGNIIRYTKVSGSSDITTSEDKTYEELPNKIYDEIKQDNGLWKAYKRCSNDRASNNANTYRGEYIPLQTEEVYVLDDQTIPTELTVADQGIEEILPTNSSNPTNGAAIMEIQYGAVPSRGGVLLGSNNNVNNDDSVYDEDEQPIPNEDER